MTSRNDQHTREAPSFLDELLEQRRRRKYITLSVVLALLIAGEVLTLRLFPSFVHPAVPRIDREDQGLVKGETDQETDSSRDADAVADAQPPVAETTSQSASNVSPSNSNAVGEASRSPFVLPLCVALLYPGTTGFGNGASLKGSFTGREIGVTQELCRRVYTAEQLEEARAIAENDEDADGLNSLMEKTVQSSPLLVDADGDGYADLTEVERGFDPTSPAGG